ncbi:multiple sugar transport system permease protein/N,N'-diacetylchitobiose transport system permease protein [Streptosporangium becharense]|uniref:Multiple sugar transport system permease protein/N,N'-diacetylchitobiose transport system permease protein n=1 Tax=Streptosporangium becharense TaxID=1816182 RepID=A0A7W9ILN1_9ACTN|nr:sugar ABC transporter permease [Streptosporangium becharense]MBB2910296.1 multiple sugar transport system permease protein/N,N'-diacetylchitobiose transport system permease protein [Streptosporangium becharense]MBB5823039.1 multiple sugar transport system permease protein/N,N'-diacetylchitobiose transport system permease protein [Streptosporangium becharense]
MTSAAPARDSGGRNERQWPLALALLTPSLIVVLGVVLYPMGRTLALSLVDATSALQADFDFVGLDNYTTLLSDSDFWATVWRTAVFTVFSTAVELVVGLLVAQFLNQRIRGQWFFRSLVVLAWALPTIVGANMWRWILHPEYGALNGLLMRLGLLESYQDWIGGPQQALFVVALIDAWKTVPLVAILLLASMQTIGDDVYEAAAMDGAGALRRFWSITIPMLKPAIAVVLVLRTIEAFKVFDIIYIITRGGPDSGTTTMAFYTYLQAFSNQQFGIGSAAAYLTVLFIFVLSLVYLRMLRTEPRGLA